MRKVPSISGYAIRIPPIRRVNTSAGEEKAAPASYKTIAVLLI